MVENNKLLSEVSCAGITPNQPGVYILFYRGRVMKVGSAEIGIQKRMQQYYALNCHCGLNRFINEENREEIRVSYQTCAASQCLELESKLFDKYGPIERLPWAHRRPHTTQNTCLLEI